MQATSFVIPAISAATVTVPGDRIFHATTPTVATSSKTCLPVLSNRAFVAAWQARRPQLVAAAKMAQKK